MVLFSFCSLCVGLNIPEIEYHINIKYLDIPKLGWLGVAMVLGKHPVPGRPTNLDYSRARTNCTCSRCRWGCLDIFSLVYHFSPLSPSLWEMADID